MLYSDDEHKDLGNILAVIDGFAEGFGLDEITINEKAIEVILRGMRQDFPAQGGVTAASPFKKCANFMCYFITERPVVTPFPASVIGSELSRIGNHQNVMVSLHVAFNALHNATIHRQDGEKILLNKVQMSKHSYIDTVQALAKATPVSHFHLVSVFLEQVCYRFNSDACYDLEITF